MVVIYNVDGPKEKTYTTKRTVKYATVSYLSNQGRKRTRNFRLDKDGHIMAKSMKGAAQVKHMGDIEAAKKYVKHKITSTEAQKAHRKARHAKKKHKKHKQQLNQHQQHQHQHQNHEH